MIWMFAPRRCGLEIAGGEGLHLPGEQAHGVLVVVAPGDGGDEFAAALEDAVFASQAGEVESVVAGVEDGRGPPAAEGGL